jgi:DNA-binding transcriptional LysR family regulator
MLDLVRAGIGLSLARDALAMAERQERGLVIADGVRLPCALSFIWRADRAAEPVISAALEMLDSVWDAIDRAA